MKFENTTRRWHNEMVICAASGPSLTHDVSDVCRAHRVIAVSDAYRLLPEADVLYSADSAWWKVHNGCPDFKGEKWTTHTGQRGAGSTVADQYGLKVINGKPAKTFSTKSDLIHFGRSSGFQAINLAILFGAARIILVGYNMQWLNGRRHFFGDHPRPLNNINPNGFVYAFDAAAKSMPTGVEIINATPHSALKCFKQMELQDAIGCLTAL